VLLNKNNKNSGEKIKFGPPLSSPWAIFSFFLENIRRRSVRVMKLHQGLFSQKREILISQEIQGAQMILEDPHRR
jgi:hypothetical protein